MTQNRFLHITFCAILTTIFCQNPRAVTAIKLGNPSVAGRLEQCARLKVNAAINTLFNSNWLSHIPGEKKIIHFHHILRLKDNAAEK